MIYLRDIKFASSTDDDSIVAVIPLTKNQNTIISPLDLGKVDDGRLWQAHDSKLKNRNLFYCVRNERIPNSKKRKSISMHRIIMNTPEGLQVDHINGCGLDNRRSNLRNVTFRENMQNKHHERSSKYPGVSWYKQLNKWKVEIAVNKVHKFIGYFDDEKEAAKTYENALNELKNGLSVNELTTYFRKQYSEHRWINWHKRNRKWTSSIKIHDKIVHLGYFNSETEALNEYKRALNEFEETGKVTRIHIKKQTSKYHGVHLHKATNKWVARIRIEGKLNHLGYFKSELKAVKAYEKAKNALSGNKENDEQKKLKL